MTFAEDKTYKYIRDNHSKFCCLDVLEILPYLPCLTASDQDRLRASYKQLGNQDTLWELFNKLQRRVGWVEYFIYALKKCELPGLADQVTRVYQSYLPPGTLLRSLSPPESPAFPATTSGPSAWAPGHSIPDNGYQERPSYPRPVQDTQPPESLGKNSEQAPSSSFGAIPRMSGGSLMPSPNPEAPSPLPSREHHGQEPELGGPYTAIGVDSIPIPTHGPVSPTVSFQPLPRTTQRTSHLPGVTVSVPSADTSLFSSSAGLAFTKEAGDQVKAATCLSTDGAIPTNSVTTSSVSSPKALPVTAMSSRVPSKLPISTRSTAATPSPVLTNIAPSKLPINSAYAGTMPSKVPATVAKAPANVMPPNRSSNQGKETLEPPTTTVTTRGNLPGPDSSSRSLYSRLDMSKPGVLVSQVDEPFSGCSMDLAISSSSSLTSQPNHGPEENEYSSFRIQVDECASADHLAGNPGPLATQEPPEDEELCVSSVSWPKWLMATSALLAAFLAVMVYRSRRLAQ